MRRRYRWAWDPTLAAGQLVEIIPAGEDPIELLPDFSNMTAWFRVEILEPLARLREREEVPPVRYGTVKEPPWHLLEDMYGQDRGNKE